jgi:hypothetical protein
MSEFDDPQLRAAMRAFVDAADALEGTGTDNSAESVRAVLDNADSKSLAALALRRRLVALGWVAPMTPAPAADRDSD